MARFRSSKPAADQPDRAFDLHRTLPNAAYVGTAAAKPAPRSVPWRKIFKRTLLVLLVLLLLVGGWLGWKAYQNSSKIFGGNLFDVFNSTKLRGEADGRVTILLIGNSADDPGHGGANLTDSIMVASLDTVNKKATLVSVPRDLYVNIPGSGYAKINEAYQSGEAEQAGTGPDVLSSIIERDLGMEVNYYALLNYTAFRDTVNALGGITVTINSSDSRGLYDGNIARVDGGPLRLANGVQELDGQTALNLARARGATNNSYGFGAGDFTRTEHQRMMLIALKNKATSGSTVLNPVKLTNLLDAVGDNVTTDLTPAEARRLYDLTKDIPESQIASASVNGSTDNRLLTSYRTRTGQSALVPLAGIDNYADIQAYLNGLMTTN